MIMPFFFENLRKPKLKPDAVPSHNHIKHLENFGQSPSTSHSSQNQPKVRSAFQKR